jgi:dimethylargininase
MAYRFTRALTRLPGESFAQGLTNAALGAPDLSLALSQHAAYCDALRRCGLEVQTLAADVEFPDSTFVEDTAILAKSLCVVTRPGAASRQLETVRIAATLSAGGQRLEHIAAPGTVDGGDICQIEDRFFIGVSARTNPAGAAQLQQILASHGYRAILVDIRANRTLLHLKSGIAYLGDGRIAVAPELPRVAQFNDYELIEVPAPESYATNCVRINDSLLIAAGYTRFAALLTARGYAVIPLDVSEYRKMDGGLSCLSLRY